MRKLITLLAFVATALVARSADAQTSLTADRIYLGATGCAMRTGAGTPTGGTACDFYLDTATGHVWMNVGGTWVNVSTTVSVGRGGTGVTSLTAGGVVYGNGTNPVGVTTAPPTNSVLGSASGVPLFTTGPTVVSLTATSSVITPTVGAAANLSLQPTGDLLIAPAGRDVLPGTNYTVNLGALEDKYLTLHAAELWVETLVAQQTMATIGGRVLVAPTNILAVDLTAAATTITVKYNNFLNGDIVYMEANARVEFMGVTSAAGGSAGAYTYTVTRNLDGSGANVWNAGDALLDTGTPGKGFIDLYSLSGVLSGAGPTIVGNVRTGTAFNSIAPRWAIGNLNGVGYGHSTDTYGFAAGNHDGAFMYLDDSNGLVMAGPGGVKMQLQPNGNALFTGTVTAGAGAIGGWSIGGDYLRDAGDSTGMASTVTGANDVRFYAGASFANRAAAPFRVYEDGSAVMSSVLVTAPNAGAGGAALNADANTADVGLWANCGGACQITNISDGKVGATSLRSVTGVQALPLENRKIPFDANKTYRFHVWARAGGGANGALYVGLAAFDASGVQCDTAGCPSAGSRYSYCASGIAAASLATWTEYICTYGAGSGYPVPAAMRTVAVQAILNLGASAGWMEIQDIRLEEMSPSTLIKDNAITTGKITANAITAGKIAANTITVNELNATGFGDNVIKNGAFEPSMGEATGSASGLAGWVNDASNSNSPAGAGAITPSCCGTNGPGTMRIDPGDGFLTAAVYQAFPVVPGQTYRVSGRIFANQATSIGVYILLNESNVATGGVRRVFYQGTYPDVSRTSYTAMTLGLALVAGWQPFEYLYTVPTGIYWVSLAVFDVSGTASGSIYTPVHFDDIEVQKQIGTGHIRANAITANLIAAGAITADKIAAGAITAGSIAAGSITGDKIAASTITGTNIAGGTITGTNIAADSITGAHIVAGTITASDIASGTITADRLNVTALSAITANLGSVTAGNLSAVAISGGTIDGTTIRGVTITASSTITGGSISGGSITGVSITGSSISAGSGYVTIDANGISVSNGAASAFGRIKLGGVELWGDGTALITGSGFNAPGLLISGDAHITNAMRADGDIFGRHVNATGNYYLASGNSLYWSSGSPSAATGFTLVMANCGGAYCVAYQSSSQRDKENVRPWAPADPLALLALPLYRYDRKDEPGVSIGARDHVGFMVEDLVQFAPDAVGRDLQGRPASFYSDTLDTYLLAALKAVNARVTRTEELEARILELEKQVAALAARKGGRP